jgi:hypothetical protein
MLAKAPNRKRAMEYLIASGAVPITIIERDGVCSISAGGKITDTAIAASTGTVAARWWITAAMAPRVATAARQCAGANPDVPAATASLARSASRPGRDVDA